MEFCRSNNCYIPGGSSGDRGMSAARLMQLLACIAAFLALVLAVNAVVVPRVLGPSAGIVSHSNANGSSSASGPPSTGDGNWTQTGTPPFLRERSAVAYDSQSDQVVLFGGLQGLDFQNDTWAYDPSTASWTNDTIGTAPAARVDAAMAYDGGAQRVIIFGGAWWVWDPSGGILYGKTYADTWAYDSVNKTWTELHPIDSPPALTGAWMVYDTAAKRLILFGGDTFHSFLGVTWAYDYENNTWTNLTPGASPSPRTGASLSYDGSEDRVILFGGNDGRGSGIFLDDT